MDSVPSISTREKMMQEYSRKDREGELFSLPDLEVFHIPDDRQFATQEGDEFESGWYWWRCLPGCLPDSEPMGPFETPQEALRNARKDMGCSEESSQ